ncbi:MAG: ABC-type branched-subunit amino acid transport system ATPase component [Natronomonas sp.]|jgi:ABC-type branched-subunit amino acid transport system ATPase component
MSEPQQPADTGPEADAGTAAGSADRSGTDPSTVDDPILEVRNLRKEFGGIVAVDGASFSIERGSMTGLIGPNGAGKSTTFNCITGIHRPDSGAVVFDGRGMTGLRPEQVVARGLVRTFQIARELPEMTVIENMMLGPKNQLGESLWRSVTPGVRGQVVAQEEDLRERAWETLEFFEIDHLGGEKAGSLSGGQRKLLELARALSTDPDLLLLDEPMAGVNPSLEEKLLDRLHELRTQGYSFLVVEHDMDMIMNNCERVVVMHQGQVLAEGAPADVRSTERVVDAYLGGDI